MFDYFEEAPKDIIGHLRPLFEKGACYVREDGKIGITGKNASRVPWIYITPEGGVEEEHNRKATCMVCMDIKFKYYKFVPIRCHACWKVVVRPRTLSELFALHELQKELGLWSKAGIEERPYVPANYSGYFYNDTLDKARQCKVVVERRIAADISPDIPIFIQRGCTEYEKVFPERSWRIPQGQKEFEAELDALLVVEVNRINPPDYVVRNTKRQWVEFAFQRGDATYLEFTHNRPLHQLPETY